MYYFINLQCDTNVWESCNLLLEFSLLQIFINRQYHKNACMIFVSSYLYSDEVIKLFILRSWKIFRCFTCMTLVLYQHYSLINLQIMDLVFAIGEEGIIPLRGCYAKSQQNSTRKTFLPQGSGPKDSTQWGRSIKNRNGPGVQSYDCLLLTLITQLQLCILPPTRY